MTWEQFLQGERARKAALVQHLLSGAPIAPDHQAISQQLIAEHRHDIAEIDAMTPHVKSRRPRKVRTTG